MMLTRLLESSDLMSAWVGGELHQGAMVPVSASVLRKSCSYPCPSSTDPEVSEFSSSSYIPGTLGAAVPALELRVCEFVMV